MRVEFHGTAANPILKVWHSESANERAKTMRNLHHGYASNLQRQVLLDEVTRLRKLLPDTPTTKRNLANIEKHNPVDKMEDYDLRSFVDLLSRSISK